MHNQVADTDAPSRLIARLREQDIFLQLKGEQLRVTSRAGKVPAAVLEELKGRKDDLIAFLKQQAQLRFDQIPCHEEQEYYQAAHAQRRLWILDQFPENRTAYNMISFFLFRGTILEDALRKAMQFETARHETLRTTFVMRNDTIWQRVHTQPLPGSDLVCTNLSKHANSRDLLQQIITREAAYAYDLERGPLFGVRLVQTAADEYCFILRMHHIIADAWTINLLYTELQYLYNQIVQRQEATLPPLRIQYRHFAAWQHALLKSPEGERQRTYWTQQLQGTLPVLALPADHQRPAVKTNSGAMVTMRLDGQLQRQLGRLAKKTGANMFMALTACISGVLYRYTGLNDLLLGTPVAGRDHADLENQLGLFVNTLVLRFRFSGSDPFETLLGHVQEVMLQAWANQAYPFDLLVEDLRVKGDRSRNPLFDVMVSYEKADNDPHRSQPAAAVGENETFSGPVTSKFDLTCNFCEYDDGIAVQLIYNTDLFDRQTIQNLAAHLEGWIRAVTSLPQTPVDRVDYLIADEKRYLTEICNDTYRDYGNGYTITGLFRQQVNMHPGRTAVVFEDMHLSYGALDHCVKRLAAYLRKQGIGVDVLVPVCLDRSQYMIIGMLAILQAGGAYVPVDPEYPAERIAYILSDTSAKWVLTTGSCIQRLPALNGVDAICLDELVPALIHLPEEAVPAPAGNAHAAYVIYTSGSTGAPKGVVTGHAAIVNRILWAQEYFALAECDVVLQKTTCCFDVSVWELFWPLCVGAREVFARPGGHKMNSYLKTIIQRECISTIHFVPSMLEVFLADLEPGDCSALQRVLCSGEALNPAHVLPFGEKLPSVELHNLYGPTEAAIDATCYTVPPAGPCNSVPIGKPVANTRIYILDAHLQPVPANVVGELYIGGIQLANGYLNKPMLTHERFVEDRFIAGGRMYRTGDLARRQHNGQIEYLGRNDHQIKIRGFRIELGEIETVLAQAPGVQQAVVTVTDESNGLRKLIAYVAPQRTIGPEAVMQYVKERLPAYMVPAWLIPLDAIPLTPNGKADRKGLPAPAGEAFADRHFIAPRTHMETIIAAIWQELLGIERVGIYDQFFHLGGNSLILMRMVTHIRKAMQVEIPIRTLFNLTTIHDLARYLELMTAERPATGERFRTITV